MKNRTVYLRSVDRFFERADRWSRILAWFAIAGACLVILYPALLKIIWR